MSSKKFVLCFILGHVRHATYVTILSTLLHNAYVHMYTDKTE